MATKKKDNIVLPSDVLEETETVNLDLTKTNNSCMGIGGIGTLSLQSVRTLPTIGRFTVRELTYRIPDFNIVELSET